MLNYTRILEANNAIQTVGDDTYWLCVTRTVQESKLFPVPSYMLLSYLCCFYRYPELLRKIETRLSAEEIGDRARAMGGKFGNLTGWALPTFFLLGREFLLNFGVLAPQDAADDVAYVMDFWRRFKLSQQREDGHLNAREFGQRVQLLPERRIQRFHADMHACAPGDRLHQAAQTFLATVSQYGFLVSCESRCTLNNSGPYKIADNREMIVRDFSDLAQGDYPWLDGIADHIPYANLTVTMEAKDCHFYLVDDWGSFKSKPEFTAEKLSGIGLYTSDPLTEGFMPIGMESPEKLTETLESLTETFRKATAELWKRIASWSRDQMMDAGAIVYFSLIKDMAHLAGVYEVDDWMKIDARADRFRPLLNDEFGRDFLGELVGLVDLPTQHLHEYAMMQHNNRPARYISHIPYDVLNTPSESRIAPFGAGITHLPPKIDRYVTSAGPLSLADYNARAAAFRPKQMDPRFRFICNSSIRANPKTEDVRDLYLLEQEQSPLLRGKGYGLTRGEIDRLRGNSIVSGPRKSDDIEQLIADFQKSGMRELHIRTGDFKLYLSNDASAQGLSATQKGVAPTLSPTAAPAAASTAGSASQKTADFALPDGGVFIRAPYLGTFYRAPKPGAPVYVNEGDIVDPGAEMCLVEVMKLFTAVRAEARGKVHSILVQDGQMVEADQPLFIVVPV